MERGGKINREERERNRHEVEGIYIEGYEERGEMKKERVNKLGIRGKENNRNWEGSKGGREERRTEGKEA